MEKISQPHDAEECPPDTADNDAAKPPAPGSVRLSQRQRSAILRLPIRDRAEWLRWRRRDITASAAGALFQVHEYQTFYGLWQEKAGRFVDPVVETSAMRRGRLIEPVAIAMLREDRPTWTVHACRTYYRDPDLRLGATPDCRARDPARPGWGNIQIKSADSGVFRRKWHNAAGELEPPLWIALQALVEAHLTGASWAVVAVIVPAFAGFDLHLVEVPLHSELIATVRERVVAFWSSVEAETPPSPDFTRDADLFLRLQPEPDGSRIDLSDDTEMPALLTEDESLAAEIKGKTDRRKAISAEVAGKLGPASYATFRGGYATSRLVERKGYTVCPSSFHDVRLRRAEP